MKLILIGLFLMSFHAGASNPTEAGYCFNGLCWTEQEPAECKECLNDHKQCVLLALEPEAVVESDVKVCDDTRVKCLTTHNCWNKE